MSKYEKLIKRIEKNKLEIRKDLEFINKFNCNELNFEYLRLFMILNDLKILEVKAKAGYYKNKRYERNRRDLTPAQYR